ncbi:MAG TPA: hypothetical protein VM578_09860 [Candidatus Saccharimonadales bacterium]|nr:hypothetical protein [Candidatus Saccharimonadales bacterium]
MMMISTQADLMGQKHGAAKVHSGSDDYEVRKGNYIGIVRESESQYEFLVRDMRREGPTIHGCGMDFRHAASAVRQILNALTSVP